MLLLLVLPTTSISSSSNNNHNYKINITSGNNSSYLSARTPCTSAAIFSLNFVVSHREICDYGPLMNQRGRSEYSGDFPALALSPVFCCDAGSVVCCLLRLGTLPSLQRLPRPLVLHASLPESGLVASSVFLQRPAVEIDTLGFGVVGRRDHHAHSTLLDGFGSVTVFSAPPEGDTQVDICRK